MNIVQTRSPRVTCHMSCCGSHHAAAGAPDDSLSKCQLANTPVGLGNPPGVVFWLMVEAKPKALGAKRIGRRPRFSGAER